MAFHVRDPHTDILVRELARERGVGLTEAVKLAVQEALQCRQDELDERRRRSQAIIDRIAGRTRTGLKADKAFFDRLSGD